MRTLRRPRNPSSEAWSFFGGFETQAFYLVVFFLVFVENIAINQSNALIRKKGRTCGCRRPVIGQPVGLTPYLSCYLPQMARWT